MNVASVCNERNGQKVRQKVIETAAMMKTAAKVAKDKSAPRLNVASAHKK